MFLVSYSPQDCLVFGGNFLHDQGISNQIRVAQIEQQNSVPTHFKYPHFDELHWCALASIVRRALNGMMQCEGAIELVLCGLFARFAFVFVMTARFQNVDRRFVRRTGRNPFVLTRD